MSVLDILMPHYRDPDGLAASLASVAAQTWLGDLRVVVLDDGSPKGEFAKAQAVVADAGIDAVLLRNEVNQGRPVTRNRLLDAARAPYLAWLDAGDVWYPGKLSAQFGQLHAMRHAGEDIDTVWVSCHYDWQWQGSQPKRIAQITEGDQLREILLGDRLRAYLWTLLGSARAFRIAGRFDERLPRMQDLDYFIRFVRGGGRIATPRNREALCCYHKSDLGRNAAEIRRCNDLIMAKNRQVLDFYGSGFTRRVRYKVNHTAARFAGNNRDRWARLRYEAQAVLADPYYAAYRAKQSLING